MASGTEATQGNSPSNNPNPESNSPQSGGNEESTGINNPSTVTGNRNDSVSINNTHGVVTYHRPYHSSIARPYLPHSFFHSNNPWTISRNGGPSRLIQHPPYQSPDPIPPVSEIGHLRYADFQFYTHRHHYMFSITSGVNARAYLKPSKTYADKWMP